jgi:cytochrome o ubiquinol oxidase subunit 2
MPAMETQLNAVLNKTGTYEGFSANFSGDGFSQMRFGYKGVTAAEFDTWVQSVKTGGGNLGRSAYVALEKPSIAEPVARFGAVEPDLFHAVLNRCVAEGSVCMNQQMADDAKKSRESAAMKQAQSKTAALQVAAAEICTTPENTVKK